MSTSVRGDGEAGGARVGLRIVLGVVAGLAVAAVAGYLLKVDPKDVAAHVAGVSPSVLGCVASGFVMFGLQSLRWHSVMGPVLGLRYGDAYRAQVVGMMFNALLPMRGGDLLRVQYLSRRTGKSRAMILGTEIVDRWLDWWGWIPVILLLAIGGGIPSWAFKAVGLFAALLITWAASMLVLTRRGVAPKPGSRFGAVYASLHAGIQAFRSRRMWTIAFLIAPLPWLWEATVLTQASQAFGIHISLAQAFCVLVGFNLAAVVPSPGQIGTVETGGTAALAFFGADHDAAVAFMVVYHFAQLLPGVIAGVAILVAGGERMFDLSASTVVRAGVAPDVAIEAAASESPPPPAPRDEA